MKDLVQNHPIIREINRGGAGRAMRGNDVLVLAIRRRVGEEGSLNWIERRGSEETFGWIDGGVES